MKQDFSRTHKRHKIVTVLLLSSILSLCAGMNLLDAATISVASSLPTDNITPLKQSRASQLPPAIVNAVRSDVSRRTGIARGQLRVVSSSAETWSDTCLGLATPEELCGQMLVEGWRVVVTDGSQKWTYRTDSTGSTVRLEKDKPDNQSGSLPRTLANTVLQTASQRTGLLTSELRIVKSEQMVADGCLGLGGAAEACLEIAQNVWEVTVEAKQQRLVYRIDSNGSQIRLNQEASSISDGSLPKSVSDRVVQFASDQLRLPISQLEITQAQQQTWSNSCLDLQRPEERCMGVITPGWRVTVAVKKGGQLVYHTDDNGTRIRFNQEASRISANFPNAILIPDSELPPPLGQREIFRAITTGGIAGITYQTTLTNEGEVIRVPLGLNNNTTPPPQISRISRQQLQRFQQVLQRAKFSQFNHLQFPAPPGSADYFSITLTSKEGTTRYVDIAQDQLPESLQSVIQAWNQIAN